MAHQNGVFFCILEQSIRCVQIWAHLTAKKFTVRLVDYPAHLSPLKFEPRDLHIWGTLLPLVAELDINYGVLISIS